MLLARECIAAHLGVLYERYLYHVRRVQPGPGVLCGGDGETECTSGLQDSGGQHSHSLLTGLVSIWRSRDLAAVTRASNEGCRRLHEVLHLQRRWKAPSRAFSWLKVPSSAFTFKIHLRHL